MYVNESVCVQYTWAIWPCNSLLCPPEWDGYVWLHHKHTHTRTKDTCMPLPEAMCLFNDNPQRGSKSNRYVKYVSSHNEAPDRKEAASTTNLKEKNLIFVCCHTPSALKLSSKLTTNTPKNRPGWFNICILLCFRGFDWLEISDLTFLWHEKWYYDISASLEIPQGKQQERWKEKEDDMQPRSKPRLKSVIHVNTSMFRPQTSSHTFYHFVMFAVIKYTLTY